MNASSSTANARIDCLMGTYGRYNQVCEALACFLQQSAISEATLLIYNQHPEPLFFDHPRVRIVNEVRSDVALRDIKHRMAELARPGAEFIHWWDHDDLFLPWHLQEGLDHIGQHVAWKPIHFWLSQRDITFSRHTNMAEGTWLLRADHVRKSPLDTHPTYIDHPVFRQILDESLLKETELGDLSTYIYRWADGATHVSALGHEIERPQQIASIAQWRSTSTGVHPGGVLVPADLTLRWQQYLDGIHDQVTPDNWKLIRSRLGLPPPSLFERMVGILPRSFRRRLRLDR